MTSRAVVFCSVAGHCTGGYTCISSSVRVVRCPKVTIITVQKESCHPSSEWSCRWEPTIVQETACKQTCGLRILYQFARDFIKVPET